MKCFQGNENGMVHNVFEQLRVEFNSCKENWQIKQNDEKQHTGSEERTIDWKGKFYHSVLPGFIVNFVI